MGLISGILGIESPIVLSSGIGALLGVAVSIFVILAEIRRLHDTGKSGWYLLMSLIPFVGSIIVLIFLCTAGNPNDNQYGSC